MKKNIKFMLVALLAVFGFGNAMAAELVNSTQYDTNGFQYVIKSMTKSGDTWTGTVSMKQNTFSGTSITINPTVKITVEGSVSGVDCKGTVDFKIVEIEANGFAGLSDVTSITFTEGCNIEKIGAGAFSGTSIADLDLTKTKITKLEKLFENNNVALNSVELPATITELATNALANCIQLSSVDFSLCTALTTLGDGSLSNTIVDTYDFSNCYTLNTEGDAYASFLNFTATENPFVNATTKTNKNLETVILPKAATLATSPVSEIGTVFANCEKLTTITNLEVSQITTVADGAFAGDISLTELSFPKTLTQLKAAFGEGDSGKGCEKLAKLTFDGRANVAIGDGTNPIFGAAALYGGVYPLEELYITVPAPTAETDPLTTTAATISADALTNNGAESKLWKVEIAKDGVFAGTVNAFALAESKDAEVTTGNIGAATMSGQVTGPTGIKSTALTIGEYNISTSATAAIVTGTISKATVGAVKEGSILNAIGQAREIDFTGDINATIAAPSANNTVLTTINFNAVKISDNAIGAAAFNETTAPALTDVTWTPADDDANHAFATDAFGASSVGAAAKVTLHTTTKVATDAGIGYQKLEANLYNIIFDATDPEVEPVEVEVYGNASATYFYGKFTAKGSNIAIEKESKDGEQVVVYSAFVDSKDQAIYMDPLALSNGRYIVKNGETVVIRLKSPAKTEEMAKPAGGLVAKVTVEATSDKNTMRYNSTPKVVNDLQVTTKIFSSDYIGTNYVGKTLYAMKNPASEGKLTWAKVDVKSYLPKGALFVETAESAAARLNVIWLDGSETAIQSVLDKKAAQDGVVYNLAGQKVDANYKGIVIKNGKKMIQK